MKITTETITKTNVDVNKDDKEFLKAYYKEIINLAMEHRDADIDESIYSPYLKDDYFEDIPSSCFSGVYLLFHLNSWLISSFYNTLANYEYFNIEWKENGENKCLNLLSLRDDVDSEEAEGNLWYFIEDLHCLSKDEDVYNEILLPLIKEHIDCVDGLEYSIWKRIK